MAQAAVRQSSWFPGVVPEHAHYGPAVARCSQLCIERAINRAGVRFIIGNCDGPGCRHVASRSIHTRRMSWGRCGSKHSLGRAIVVPL